MASGQWARRVIIATCVVIAGALMFSVLPRNTNGASATRPLKTSFWSVRRVPQNVSDGIGAQQLDANLASALGSGSSCVKIEAGGTPVVTLRNDQPVIPASTKKLLTGLVALTLLGPDFRYHTRVVASSSPKNGDVKKLYLVGSGDPVLSSPGYQAALAKNAMTSKDVTTPLNDLVDAIVKAGVKNIPDGIVGDESRYDNQQYLLSWSKSYASDGFIGPMSAL